jgi:hypothetical protein
MLRALMARDEAAAAAALVGNKSLAAEVLGLWQAAGRTVLELEACRPALQQLFLGFAITHQRLKASAADITASVVASGLQAAAPAGHQGQSEAAVVAAARSAAVAAISGVAPCAHETAAAAATVAVAVAVPAAAAANTQDMV